MCGHMAPSQRAQDKAHFLLWTKVDSASSGIWGPSRRVYKREASRAQALGSSVHRVGFKAAGGLEDEALLWY